MVNFILLFNVLILLTVFLVIKEEIQSISLSQTILYKHILYLNYQLNYICKMLLPSNQQLQMPNLFNINNLLIDHESKLYI